MSVRYDILRKKAGREQWYKLLLVALVLVAGLRWRLGVDTPNYIFSFYYTIPDFRHLTFEDIDATKPMWILLNSIVKSLGGRFYIVQIIQAIIVNVLYFLYIRKHSKYIFTCVLFFFLYCYTNQNMEEMKASISVVLCLFGNDYVLEKKWMRAYVLYTLAVLFHISAFLILLTPLFIHLRFNVTGTFVLIASFFLGYILQANLGDYLAMLDAADETIANRAQLYAESERYLQQGGNVFFYIVHIIPFILYSVICYFYTKRKGLDKQILQLEPFLMCGLVCIVFQMNVQIFYRYVHFYAIYLVLFFAQSFCDMILRDKKSNGGTSYAKSMLIFLPLMFCMLYSYNVKYMRYYPYSSVIERSVDRQREMHYINCNRPSPNQNEY